MGLDSRESISKPSTTGKCNNYTHGMRYFPLDKHLFNLPECWGHFRIFHGRHSWDWANVVKLL